MPEVDERKLPRHVRMNANLLITKQQITRNLAFTVDSWSLWLYLQVSLPYLVEQSIC